MALQASEAEVERLRTLVADREQEIQALEEEADLLHEVGSIETVRALRSRLGKLSSLAEQMHSLTMADVSREVRTQPTNQKAQATNQSQTDTNKCTWCGHVKNSGPCQRSHP